MQVNQYITVIIFTLLSLVSAGQKKDNNYLLAFSDSSSGEELWGFKTIQGKTIIQPAYQMTVTDTMFNIAFVTNNYRWVAINRHGKTILTPYIFDNGPDCLSNGLFRIVQGNKIGYADQNGHIVIQPRFDCAYPFENNKAKVGSGCILKNIGEHSVWTGGRWHYINKKGKTLPNRLLG